MLNRGWSGESSILVGAWVDVTRDVVLGVNYSLVFDTKLVL